MPMIGQQTPGHQICSRALNRLPQDLFERLVVTILFKDGHPRIGTVQHMINQPAVSGSFWSSHSTQSITFTPLSQDTVPDTFFSSFLHQQPRPKHFRGRLAAYDSASHSNPSQSSPGWRKRHSHARGRNVAPAQQRPSHARRRIAHSPGKHRRRRPTTPGSMTAKRQLD